MIWPALLIAALACYAVKFAGLSVPRHWLDDPRVSRVAAGLPVALLATLVALQTVTHGQHLVLDARLAGLAVAAVAVSLRAPFLVVVGSATVATALVRLVVVGS